MHPEDIVGRQHDSAERQRQHQDEQCRLQHVAHIGAGVLDIDLAVGHVGNDEKDRLRGDTAHTIGDGQRGLSVPGRSDGGYRSAERGAHAQKQCAHHGLAEPRPVGQPVGDRADAHATKGHDERRGTEHGNDGTERQIPRHNHAGTIRQS